MQHLTITCSGVQYLTFLLRAEHALGHNTVQWATVGHFGSFCRYAFTGYLQTCHYKPASDQACSFIDSGCLCRLTLQRSMFGYACLPRVVADHLLSVGAGWWWWARSVCRTQRSMRGSLALCSPLLVRTCIPSSFITLIAVQAQWLLHTNMACGVRPYPLAALH